MIPRAAWTFFSLEIQGVCRTANLQNLGVRGGKLGVSDFRTPLPLVSNPAIHSGDMEIAIDRWLLLLSFLHFFHGAISNYLSEKPNIWLLNTGFTVLAILVKGYSPYLH